MKRIFAFCTLIMLLFTLCGCSDNVVKGSIVKESADGNAELDIMPQKLLEQANIGDIVVVTVGDFKKEMIFTDEPIEQDGTLQLLLDRSEWSLSICIYNENFCREYDIEIKEKVRIYTK